jgi:phenylalanyl-tRNA synthetase beta chain
MKISYNWLKSYVAFDWTPQELGKRLTMGGLEVEGIEEFETVKGSLAGVVVGEVMTCQRHPNADKLSLTTVDVGGEAHLHIVCGAPNVAAGQKVLVATIGAMLYPLVGEPFEIKKSKIRGEESQGMICAEDELGLGQSHAGIIVLDAHWAVGTPAAKVFQVESDQVLEIGLTPNRVDAASHYGVARDVAALLRTRPTMPAIAALPAQAPACPIKIELPEPDKCPLYVGIHIQGVKVGESPDWLKNRLKSIGSRPINNVVDATNFVLHELGQPLHAFDADRIRGGKIIVRSLPSDSPFTTLDGQSRNLLAQADLLICDAEGPVALAGIMGGQNSEVDDNTVNVFLESAWFEPKVIRTTGARLGLKTDASFRFERGADPNMAETAALRCAQLIQELAGGTLSGIAKVAHRAFPPHVVTFDLERANRLMGHNFSRAAVEDILHHLEIETKESGQAGVLDLHIPAYRVDVVRPQDVMEDILRIHGYNNVPISRQSRLSYDLEQRLDKHTLLQRYLDSMAANGWSELITNPLVPARFAHDRTANLLNNLSEDLAVMRENMLHTGLEVLEYNQNRKSQDLRLMEFAKTYHREEGKYSEKEWLVLYMTGQDNPAHWRQKPQPSSFFTLAREIERLQSWFGFSGELREIEDKQQWAYGMELAKGEKVIARFGKVHPSQTKGRDIRGDVFYAEIDWEAVLRLYKKNKVAYTPLSKFPAVRRDVSMIVPKSVVFQKMAAAVRACNPKLIREVAITDVYEGANIGEGKKSYLISLTLLDEQKTMTDDVAEKVMERVFAKLEGDFGVEIRK